MNEPYEKIKREYELRPEAQSFDWYLNWHHEHGYVHSTPSFFIMGFSADSSRLEREAPMDCYDVDGDCWYLFAFAGDMSEAWDIMPCKLPLLAWHRDRDGGKDLQMCALEKIQRLSKRGECKL